MVLLVNVFYLGLQAGGPMCGQSLTSYCWRILVGGQIESSTPKYPMKIIPTSRGSLMKSVKGIFLDQLITSARHQVFWPQVMLVGKKPSRSVTFFKRVRYLRNRLTILLLRKIGTWKRSKVLQILFQPQKKLWNPLGIMTLLSNK